MAWIESHQELRHHYKTKRLARDLKVSVAAAIGHLHCLWWWALDFAPDGDLSKFDDYEIADAILYEGKDPHKAKAALISAGFLDNSEDGTLSIHDWDEYAGRLLDQREEKRQKERDRKKKYREKKRDAGDIPPHVPQDRKECPALVPRDTHGTDAGVPPLQYSTQHNSTVHNTTEQDRTRDTPPIPPASGGLGTGAEGTLQQQRFAEFWETYPKKVGKGAAEKAWGKIRPDKPLFDRIMASLQDSVRDNADWERENGKFIPNPSTWLNERRWEDEIHHRKSKKGGGAYGGTGGTGGGDAGFRPSTGFRDAD